MILDGDLVAYSLLVQAQSLLRQAIDCAKAEQNREACSFAQQSGTAALRAILGDRNLPATQDIRALQEELSKLAPMCAELVAVAEPLAGFSSTDQTPGICKTQEMLRSAEEILRRTKPLIMAPFSPPRVRMPMISQIILWIVRRFSRR